MADEAETPNEEEELLLTEEVGQEEPVAEENAEPPVAEDDEEVPAFGDEPEQPEPETPTIKHMRSELSKAHRELAELRRQQTSAEPEEELGPEPDLWSEEIAGDPDLFATALRQHDAAKARIEAKKRERSEATANQAKLWETELQSVAEEKAALAKPDADEAFDTVRTALSDHQNIALLHTVDKGNRAKLIYALAKSPAKLEHLSKLSGETNLIRFIKEVAKLEGQLKMVKRRKAPDPDVPERPSAGASVKVGSAQKQLDKMEAEWEKKGGDRSHIQKFKRENSLT